MKADELRIGNFIMDMGNKEWQIDCWEHSTKVAAKEPIIGFCDFTKKPMQGHPLTEDVEFLKPIPITEEWLLKFGFFIKDKTYSLNYGGESMRYALLDIPRNPFILWFHGRHGFNTQEGRKSGDYCIQYVHQLQNLYFALIGEELQINK